MNIFTSSLTNKQTVAFRTFLTLVSLASIISCIVTIQTGYCQQHKIDTKEKKAKSHSIFAFWPKLFYRQTLFICKNKYKNRIYVGHNNSANKKEKEFFVVEGWSNCTIFICIIFFSPAFNWFLKLYNCIIFDERMKWK